MNAPDVTHRRDGTGRVVRRRNRHQRRAISGERHDLIDRQRAEWPSRRAKFCTSEGHVPRNHLEGGVRDDRVAPGIQHGATGTLERLVGAGRDQHTLVGYAELRCKQ